MNNDTKTKIEKTPKINKNLRDKLYDFALKNIKEKGIAIFVFDDNLPDNQIVFEVNNITEIVKIK